MRINSVNNQHSYNSQFEARLQLNNKELLRGMSLAKESTPLDRVFEESPLVKGLNNLSWKIRLFVSKYSTDFKSGNLGKICGKAIYLLRILADRVFLMQNYKSINRINSIFKEIEESSPKYIEELAKIGKSVKSKFININTEDGVLDDITSSNEAVVFVLNHPNFHKDKNSYLIINSLLSQMYTANNFQGKCPRPKILVSKNMLKILSKHTGEIYKKLGLVEVDASLFDTNSSFNFKSMKGLMSSFINNKTNLFFFPEGNKSSFLKIPLGNRIQTGIARFIDKALRHKDRVKIVPVGLYYPDEKNNVANIFLGNPINFYRKNNKVCFNQENREGCIISHKPALGILEIIKETLQSAVEKAKTMD